MYYIEHKRLGEWEHANTRKTFDEARVVALNAIQGGWCYDGVRIVEAGGEVIKEWSSEPLAPITTSSTPLAAEETNHENT
jgi:hypothetical protein